MFACRSVLRPSSLAAIVDAAAVSGSKMAARRASSHASGASASSIMSRVAIFGGALGFAAFASAKDFTSAQNGLDISEVSAIDNDEYRAFRVVRVEEVAPGSKKVTLQVPQQKLLGTLPVSRVSVKVNVDGEDKEKKYAPVSPWNASLADIVVKNTSDQVDQQLYNLKAGDKVNLNGPHDLMRYKPNSYRKIGMIAGSTGIAPLFQVIQEAMFSADDYTKISLICCNTSANDILLRDELDALQELYGDRLDVHHVVEEPPAGWRMSAGHVDEAIIVEMMPSPTETRVGEAVIMVCGPDEMVQAVTGSEGEFGGILKSLHYKADHIIEFPA